MSSSGQRTHLKLLTIGDFDPQTDQPIEYDFIGRVIAGRYTIREQIGGGGMADVFRATDEELGIDVVIKQLKPRMASDELRARMVQEAQASLASAPDLDHEAVTPTPITRPDSTAPEQFAAGSRDTAPGAPAVAPVIELLAAATPVADRPDSAEASESSPPTPRHRDPEAAWHRALARRTADVQRCADKETGSLQRLAVTKNIDNDARISAHVAGAADMPLSRCLDKTLKRTPLTAPREPASFVHVFKLRTTPPRRP